MKFLLLLLLIGCQNFNSNTNDREKYGPSLLVGSVQFKTAYPIIESRCISCHRGYHNDWANYKNESDWVTKGKVVRGDPRNSPFIIRIWNSGAVEANMPQDGGPLPQSEYNTLVDWVQNIP